MQGIRIALVCAVAAVLAAPARAQAANVFDTALLPRKGGETRTYRTLRSWAASHARGGRIARLAP